MRRLRWSITLALVVLAAATRCIASTGCTQVEGERITLADLKRAAPQLDGAAAQAGESKITFAPAPGTRRTVSPAELRRLAGRFGLTGDVSQGVCFVYRSAPVTQEAIEQALRRQIPPQARITILDQSRYPAPLGQLEFPRTNWRADETRLLRGVIRYGDKKTHPFWAKVHVEWEREVSRGDRVRVEVRSGRALLRFQANAETSGRSGDLIQVRNDVSGRRFAARVLGKGLAAVEVGVR